MMKEKTIKGNLILKMRISLHRSLILNGLCDLRLFWTAVRKKIFLTKWDQAGMNNFIRKSYYFIRSFRIVVLILNSKETIYLRRDYFEERITN